METKKSPILLTRKEVAKILRISLPTLDKLSKENKLKPKKIGNKILFLENDILSCIRKSNHTYEH